MNDSECTELMFVPWPEPEHDDDRDIDLWEICPQCGCDGTIEMKPLPTGYYSRYVHCVECGFYDEYHG